MGDKTWTVVKFTDDASVATVPTDWIQNGYCLWPPFATDKVNAAIKHQKIDTCWPSHKVQVFRNATYDSYEIAREKMRKAQDTSDLNSTDSEAKTSSKRKIFKKKFYSDSSDESTKSGNESTFKNNQSSQRIKPKLPSPIKKGLSEDANKISNGEEWTFEEFEENGNETIKNIMYSSVDLTPQSKLKIVPKQLGNGNKEVESSPNKANENRISSSLPSGIRDTNKCQCYCPLHADFNSEILRQLYFLRSVTTELMTEIKNLKGLRGTLGESSVDSVMSQFKLPFNTDEELVEMDDFLKIAENFNKMERELTMWGGNSLLDFVKRCLGLLISNQLAVTYSWLGRRGKKQFCNFGVARVLANAAVKSGKCSDKKEAENEMARWLRRAPDRLKSHTQVRTGNNTE